MKSFDWYWKPLKELGSAIAHFLFGLTFLYKKPEPAKPVFPSVPTKDLTKSAAYSEGSLIRAATYDPLYVIIDVRYHERYRYLIEDPRDLTRSWFSEYIAPSKYPHIIEGEIWKEYVYLVELMNKERVWKTEREITDARGMMPVSLKGYYDL